MKRKLYKHQLCALTYCMRERHPALFMDMRLGKTLVVIRRVKLYSYPDPKILVVAPSSAIGSWKDELEAEGEERVTFLTGTTADRKESLTAWESKWYILNKEGHLTLPAVAEHEWDVVVLDESTFIKNPRAKVSRFFLRNFRNVDHRWILTGTPNPESDLEFWPQMVFLDGVFCRTRSFWDFRLKHFTLPKWEYKWEAKAGSRKIIANAVGKRAHVVRKTDVGMDIQKVREVRRIKMPTKVRSAYRTAEKEFVLEWDGAEIKTTIWATSKYIWLRQFCGGFLGKEKMVWRGKAKELLSLLQGELAGQSVVVWFNFNPEIELCSVLLDRHDIEHSILRGSISAQNREVRRRKFMDGKFDVLLVQQAVAQMGMNLSRADTAIYYSQPCSLLASLQTEERIVHPAKTTPLLYVYLQAENSVDGDIYRALQKKQIDNQYMLSRILQAELHARVLRRKK